MWDYYEYTPFKKVTQHHFDRLYQSVYGFIFIMLCIIWKIDYLSFHWYFICQECFAGMCARAIKLGSMSKNKCCIIGPQLQSMIPIVYESIFIVLGIIWKPIYFSFNWYIICYDCLSGMWANWLYWTQCQKNKCSKIASLFEICFGGFRYNEWAQVQWVRVHTLIKGKHKTWYSTHFP